MGLLSLSRLWPGVHAVGEVQSHGYHVCSVRNLRDASRIWLLGDLVGGAKCFVG